MKTPKLPAIVILTAGIVIAGCTVPTVTYQVGDYVQDGGIVFYDKGSVTDGWRYLAVASMDMPVAPNWGATSTSTGATAQVIGSGAANTATIVATYSLDPRTYAADYCDQDISGGTGDWFLPSKDELLEIYATLKLAGIGNLKDGPYWTSSENDADTAYAINLADGSWATRTKGESLHVRSVRAFP